jgi:hypothetical protein
MKKYIYILAIVILVLAVFLKINQKMKDSKIDNQTVVGENILIENSRFIPTLTSINKGQSVIVKNNDSQAYNLVSNQSNGPAIGQILPTASKKIIFNQIGSFRYQDQTNPEINITITVQ